MTAFNAIAIESFMNKHKQLPYRYWISTAWDKGFVREEKMKEDMAKHHLWIARNYQAHFIALIGIEQSSSWSHSHQIICSDKRLQDGLNKFCINKNGKKVPPITSGWKHCKRSDTHFVGWDPEKAWEGINYTLFKHQSLDFGHMFHPGRRTCLNNKCIICRSAGKGVQSIN
tara:strand:- start:191 stop:703 length:513 start_codon:yes stop_codon:yes gene_type:complete